MDGVPSDPAVDSAADHGRLADYDGVRADPGHHQVLVENAAVRVVETRIPAGAETPVHAHPYRRLMIALSGTSFARHDPDGNVLEETELAEVGRISWAEPAGLHTIRNTGPDDLVVVAVELLDGARAEGEWVNGNGGGYDA
jgi:quercetin dioxygenase-like cupin family protein